MEYSLYGSHENPGYGLNQSAVHSQTLPSIWRQPQPLSPSANAATSAQAPLTPNKLAWPGDGVASPHGYRRFRSRDFGVVAAANSHSASRGNRRPAQWQYASA